MTGPAPQGDWEGESDLRGRVIASENDVWKVEIQAPESAEMAMYDLQITLLKIGGIRETIVVKNAIEIIERDSDGDGTVDSLDAFPNDATETTDTDGDGVGDNKDAYPTDSTARQKNHLSMLTHNVPHSCGICYDYTSIIDFLQKGKSSLRLRNPM